MPSVATDSPVNTPPQPSPQGGGGTPACAADSFSQNGSLLEYNGRPETRQNPLPLVGRVGEGIISKSRQFDFPELEITIPSQHIHNRTDIGQHKIISLEEKRHVEGLRAGIGKTIDNVEPCWVAALSVCLEADHR